MGILTKETLNQYKNSSAPLEKLSVEGLKAVAQGLTEAVLEDQIFLQAQPTQQSTQINEEIFLSVQEEDKHQSFPSSAPPSSAPPSSPRPRHASYSQKVTESGARDETERRLFRQD